jgi:hypothetical protein
VAIEGERPDTARAWEEYRRILDDVRWRVLAQEWSRQDLVRAQGLYFVQMNQATAFQKYLAPRHAYPVLYVHSEFMPFEVTTGQSNPDFLYRWSYLDGARDYRIVGRRGTTRWTNFQITNGFWGDERMDTIATLDLDHVECDADGGFQITLSGREQPGNWLRLDPASGNNVLLIRETWCDWENETGVEMRIGTVEPVTEPVVYGEAEFNRRLLAAARYMDFSANFSIGTTRRILEGAGGTNRFFDLTRSAAADPAGKRVGGASPSAQMHMMIYEIERHQALIVEMNLPQARYWGLSLGDVWFATTDYSHHQSSLNDHQARVDADGKVRMVFAFEDPGVANWIDVAGVGFGLCILRRYLAAGDPEPVTRLVDLGRVSEHLPADTPRVNREKRREMLARRRRASLRRYGF